MSTSSEGKGIYLPSLLYQLKPYGKGSEQNPRHLFIDHSVGKLQLQYYNNVQNMDKIKNRTSKQYNCQIPVAIHNRSIKY